MATAEPAWRLPHPDESEPVEPVNVVRLVPFLGPVSPELALVDPDLAERARALLPDAPGIPRIRSRPPAGPAPFTAPSSGGRSGLELSPLLVALVAGAAAVASVVTLWAGPALRGEVSLETRQPAGTATRSTVEPPAASPTSPTPQVEPPAARPTSPTPRAEPETPAASQPSSTPASGAGLAAPRFVWPAQPGAEGYRVALYRAGRQIFERDVARPALELPLLWTYDGRSYGLTSGAYRWVVWPLVGREKRIGTAIVSAQYVA